MLPLIDSINSLAQNGLDLERLYQTSFCQRSNDFCRLPISQMEPSKSNPLSVKSEFFVQTFSWFQLSRFQVPIVQVWLPNRSALELLIQYLYWIYNLQFPWKLNGYQPEKFYMCHIRKRLKNFISSPWEAFFELYRRKMYLYFLMSYSCIRSLVPWPLTF